MVCGNSDYKGKVDVTLADMVKHYVDVDVDVDVVLITFCNAGPSYQASGWAMKHGVYFAEFGNLRKHHGRKHDSKVAAAALALKPDLCVSFGPTTEADDARAAGIPTYEV